jgi:hypothetical protein
MARFSLSLAPGEPAMPMWRCEMKKVLGIYNNPDQGRSTLIKAIIPIFLGLFIVPAQAQWLGPTWETNIVLTQLDLDMKKLALRDQQCEELEYTMRTARPEIYSEHYHFTSCLQPDGTWKIA